MIHRKEIRERKEREKREREDSERKAKESTGVKYWKDKFREMAEKHSKNKIEEVVRGAREHVERIERRRVEKESQLTITKRNLQRVRMAEL